MTTLSNNKIGSIHRSMSVKHRRSSFSPIRISESYIIPSESPGARSTQKKLLKQDTKKQFSNNNSIQYESLEKPFTKKKSTTKGKHAKTAEKKGLAKDLQKLESLVNPSSENTILKDKVKELRKTIKKQDQVLDELYDRVVKERKEVKAVTEKFMEAKKSDQIIVDLQERLESMHDHEGNLVRMLREQQEKAEELAIKLYELESGSKNEMETTRKYYKELYSRKAEGEIEQYKLKVKILESEKEEFLGLVKELEQIKDLHKTNRAMTDTEINALKVQLEGRTRENEVFKSEVKRLKESLKGTEDLRIRRDENEHLKAKIEELKDENRRLRLKDEENRRLLAKSPQESSRKEDKKIAEEYERRIKQFKGEISIRDDKYEKMEVYYKEQLEIARRTQEQRKKEWLEIYNDLMKDIQQLKNGVKCLDTENPLHSSQQSERSVDYSSDNREPE